MNSGTGKLEIDLNDFWEFIHGYINGNFEIQFGVPKINNENQTLEVDYLFNTECHPTEEMNYKDTVVSKQWQELNNNKKK
jgi:hypothetical protein